MAMASDTVLKSAAARLDNLGGMVKVLSPSNTLKRGYSITRVNGVAVTDAGGLRRGGRIETVLYNGAVESEVIKVYLKDNQ